MVLGPWMSLVWADTTVVGLDKLLESLLQGLKAIHHGVGSLMMSTDLSICGCNF